MLESLRASLLKWCMRQLTHTFHHHMMAMDKIRETLQQSYVADAKSAKKLQPDDVLMIWLELMNENIGGDETILGGAGPGDSIGKKRAPKGKR